MDTGEHNKRMRTRARARGKNNIIATSEGAPSGAASAVSRHATSCHVTRRVTVRTAPPYVKALHYRLEKAQEKEGKHKYHYINVHNLEFIFRPPRSAQRARGTREKGASTSDD